MPKYKIEPSITLSSLKALSKVKASGTAYRVLTILLRESDEYGMVQTDQHRIAKELKLSVPSVSNAMTYLKDAEVIASTRLSRIPSKYALKCGLRDPETGYIIGKRHDPEMTGVV